MSEILSNIVVEQTSINFSPNNNNLNVTPEAIQLNIFTGAAPSAGQSSNGELLYNNTNLIDGVPNTSFASGNLTLGNVANIKITGGVNGYVLQTDGAGNLDWTAMTGNGGGNGAPGGANTQIQYNDSGAFGGNSGFTFNEVSGNVAIPGNLSVVGNIFGLVANANYANFAGTVLTNAQPNITSVGTLGNLAVTNDINSSALTTGFITLNGNMNSNGTIAAFFFNGNGNPLFGLNGSNVIGAVANANFATTAGTVTTNAQPNITSVGTLTSLNVTGNITNANNISATNTIFANAANITANLRAGNANLGNLATANFFSGDGGLLSNINAANVVGNLSRIANGTSNVSIPTANGNITFSAGGVANIAVISNTALITSNLRLNSSIISLGANTPSNISDVVIIGNAAGNSLTGSGSVVIGSAAGQSLPGAVEGQNNVIIGAEARKFTSGNVSVTIGSLAGRNSNAAGSVFLGYSSGLAANGIGSVGVGYGALETSSSPYQVAIGYEAGANKAANLAADGAVAIGYRAARAGQGISSIAIGNDAAPSGQKNYAISIGQDAGGFDQGNSAIAIGQSAGGNQQTAAIGIGLNAGGINQGANAIAIGSGAGAINQANTSIAIGTNITANGVNSVAVGSYIDMTANNSIALNGTGVSFTANVANALFVKPIRDVTSVAGFTVALYYNPTTGEIGYK